MIRTDTSRGRQGPLLVLGVAPRSGTNHVYNLLRQHPHLHCVTSADSPEQFIVRHSRLLFRFAGTLATFWGQHWRSADLRDRGELTHGQRRAAILSALGNGLLDLFAADDDTRRIVTKTPSVDELPNAFELYPKGQVVVVMRDGRSVCESAHASAGDPHELTMQRWARAARLIADVRAGVGADRMLVVRYEDIVNDEESTLRTLFEFADIDADAYDFGAARELPVLGSSQFYGDNGKQWQRVARDDTFDPLTRWASWDHELLERFDWVAGDVSRDFGYDVAVERTRSHLHHRLRSIPWSLRSGFKRSLAVAQRRLYRVDVFGQRPLPADID